MLRISAKCSTGSGEGKHIHKHVTYRGLLYSNCGSSKLWVRSTLMFVLSACNFAGIQVKLTVARLNLLSQILDKK